MILTLVSPVHSWDPPEEKKDASLLSLRLYSHSAAALMCEGFDLSADARELKPSSVILQFERL